MRGNETMFGVNFADGRIKEYPAGSGRRGPATYYVFYVRGNTDYGKNDFHDNGDGTITDRATGLCWAKVDSGHLKAGDPSRFPRGRGPQGDVIGIYNMVRPVRGGKANLQENGPELAPQPSGRQIARRGRRGPGAMGPARQGPGSMGHGTGRPGAGTPAGSPTEFVKRLDRDGDGKVSRREFDGPARAFERNDRNRDGYLSEDEAPMRRRGSRPGGMRGRPSGKRGGPQRPGGQHRGPQAREGDAAPQGNAMVTAKEAAAAAASANVRADATWQKLPPSFVFILADDMGWTGLSVASDDRMPVRETRR